MHIPKLAIGVALMGTAMLFAQDPAAKDDKRLSPASARAHLHGVYTAANRNPGDDFNVMERTTDDAWKRLGIQVFRVTGPEHLAAETLVVRNGKADLIGRSFGGDGVTSIAVGEAGKKKSVLVYAFNWGSGVHRSQIGVYDPTTATQTLLPVSNFSFQDFQVKNDADGVAVFAGKRRIGAVAIDEANGVLTPSLRLADDVPAEIRDKIRAK